MFPYTSKLHPNYTELFKQNLIYLNIVFFVVRDSLREDKLCQIYKKAYKYSILTS